MPLRLTLRALLVGTTFSIAACNEGQFGLSRPSYDSSEQRLAALSEDLRSRPNDVKTLLAIGHENARLSNWRKSLGAYREALLVNPGDVAAAKGYTRGLVALQRYGEAEASIANVVAASPEGTDGLILQAAALAGQGRYADAKTLLRRAQALAPRDLDIRGNLALVGAMAGDAGSYADARAVAFAPDADVRHQRNLMLIGGLTGQSAAAKQDGKALGLTAKTISDLTAFGKQSRGKGLKAFGLAPVA